MNKREVESLVRAVAEGQDPSVVLERGEAPRARRGSYPMDNLNPEAQLQMADDLEELRGDIEDALQRARLILEGHPDEMMWTRAKAYWWAHMTIALGGDHGYLGGSMHSMQDSIEELRAQAEGGDDEEEDEDDGSLEYAARVNEL